MANLEFLTDANAVPATGVPPGYPKRQRAAAAAGLGAGRRAPRGR